MKINIKQLQNPPYLQVALDTPDINKVFNVIKSLPNNEHIILECGTPLIKRYGIGIIKQIRDVIQKNKFIVADLKTLDTGALEVQIAADGGADAIVVSGLAPIATIDNVISGAENRGIYSIIDTLNIDNPIPMLTELEFMPNIVELHRAIDVEETEYQWGSIPEIKELNNRTLIAVAGGVQVSNISAAITAGTDILVVGRAITGSNDVNGVTKEFLDQL